MSLPDFFHLLLLFLFSFLSDQLVVFEFEALLEEGVLEGFAAAGELLGLCLQGIWIRVPQIVPQSLQFFLLLLQTIELALLEVYFLAEILHVVDVAVGIALVIVLDELGHLGIMIIPIYVLVVWMLWLGC